MSRDHGVPTVPMVVEALLSPREEAARTLRTSLRDLLEDGRDVALELRRLVHGDLCGMFDGPTTPGLDLSAPLVVLDLSALYSSAALGVLMACATAWLQAALARSATAMATSTAGGRGRFFLVVDEAWAILSNLGVARWLQSSWKLSRAFGVSNVAVLHRVSDLRSVGASDSEQVALAQGLLADSETRVVYAQSPGELEAATELLSLSSTETDLLPQLRRGIALWKVGQRSFLVQHRLSATERLHRRHRRGHVVGHGLGGPVGVGTGGVRRADRARRRAGGRDLIVGVEWSPIASGARAEPAWRALGSAFRPAPTSGPRPARRHRDASCSGSRPAWSVLQRWRPSERSPWSSSDRPRAARRRAWRCRPSWVGAGPVVAASVKSDLLHHTLGACSRRGQVWCIDPTGSTGAPEQLVAADRVR